LPPPIEVFSPCHKSWGPYRCLRNCFQFRTLIVDPWNFPLFGTSEQLRFFSFSTVGRAFIPGVDQYLMVFCFAYVDPRDVLPPLPFDGFSEGNSSTLQPSFSFSLIPVKVNTPPFCGDGLFHTTRSLHLLEAAFHFSGELSLSSSLSCFFFAPSFSLIVPFFLDFVSFLFFLVMRLFLDSQASLCYCLDDFG